MPEGFRIASAFIDVEARVDKTQVSRAVNSIDGSREGQALGGRIGGGIGKGIAGGLLNGSMPVAEGVIKVMTTRMALFAAAGVVATGIAMELSGVVGLLAPAAVAGGLAIGTMKLATSGLSDAFKEVGGDQEKFNESIKNLAPAAQGFMTTIRGMMPTLTAFRNSIQQTFFQGLDTRLTQLSGVYLPMLQTSMGAVAGSMNGMLHGLANDFMTVRRQADMQGILQGGATIAGHFVAAVRPLVSVFLDVAAVATPMLSNMTAQIGPLTERFAAFVAKARETGQLRQWIQTGIDAFRDLWTIGGLLFGTVTNLVAILGGPSTFLGVLTLVAQVLNTVSGFIRDNLTWLQPLAIAIGTVTVAMKLVTAATTAFRIASMLLFTMNPWMLVITAVVAAVTAIIMNWDKVKAFLGATWNWIKSTASSAWNAVKNFISTAVAGIQHAITSKINQAKATWTTAINGIKAVGTAVFNALKFFISGVITGIMIAISKLSALPGKVRGWFQGAKSAAEGVMNGLVGFVRSIPGRIVSALGNLGGLLVNSGRALIDGLGRGISNAFGAVKSKVSGMMGSLRRLFPFSPAKEGPFSGSGYTTHSGSALMRDFGKGMLSQIGSVRSAADAVLRAVQKPLRGNNASASIFDSARAQQYTRELMNAIKSGATIFEDWSFRGMSKGLFSDDLRYNIGSMVEKAAGIGRGQDLFGNNMGNERALLNRGISAVQSQFATAAAATPIRSAVPTTAAPAMAGAAGARTVIIQVAGNLDPTNPTAWRQSVENLRTALRDVERSYI